MVSKHFLHYPNGKYFRHEGISPVWILSAAHMAHWRANVDESHIYHQSTSFQCVWEATEDGSSWESTTQAGDLHGGPGLWLHVDQSWLSIAGIWTMYQ